MRAINLIVEENGKVYNYNFLRIEGSDNEIAIYRLILNIDGGFQAITEFEGTMEQNARKLSEYLRSRKNVRIMKITGDIDLIRAFQFNQLDL